MFSIAIWKYDMRILCSYEWMGMGIKVMGMGINGKIIPFPCMHPPIRGGTLIRIISDGFNLPCDKNSPVFIDSPSKQLS